MKKRKYVKQRLPATRTFDTIQPETHPEEFEWKAVKRLSDTACLAATFSLSCIPPTAQSLVRVISNEGNTDAGNVAASFIAFVSGGLSNIYKVQPEQENKGWHISPNLSGLLVGPASARKSRAYRPIESFVRKAEDQLLFEYSKTEKEELAAYQFAKKKNASREQLVQKMILESLRIERNDPAKAEELMADAERLLMQMENDLEPPSAMTLIINHTTEAGLHKLKTKEIHCHFYVRDEATPLLLETMGRTQSNIKAFLIEAMDGDNDYRRNIATYYLNNIQNEHLELPSVEEGPLSHVWHVFVVRTPLRSYFIDYMNENGIQTMIHYPIPPHKQEAYKEWNELTFPISEKIHSEILSLPISPVMDMEDVKRIVEVVNEYRPN